MAAIALILFLTISAAIAFVWVLGRRQAYRRVLAESSFSPEQTAWVRENWALWDRLPANVRAEVEGLSLIFLYEKVFEACGGLEEVSAEMKTVIAAQACLLWTNQRGTPYPSLRSVLVYPDAYRVKDEFGMENIRLGESWGRGTVVLAWNSVRSGGRDEKDGHNLVIHEFAHQLDTVNGPADGFPELPDNADFQSWPEVFGHEFGRLVEDVEKGRRTVMDSYGATNEAEFFAVAAETFFEKADQIAEEHPDLYRLLRYFFANDPKSWS